MSVHSQIALIKRRIASLDAERKTLVQELEALTKQLVVDPSREVISNVMTPQEKIALFKQVFIARDDVYARRYEGNGIYKSGYTPVCANEWIPSVCRKTEIKCAQCQYRQFEPVTDQIIEMHLRGLDRRGKPFTMGTYPLMKDERCRFLVVDFDGDNFKTDAQSFVKTCQREKISAYIERSRSGNGAHIWFFFAEPITASVARRFVTLLLSKTMETNPDLGFDSYDRLLPNQDTLPKGGLGNLIALPLQRGPRKSGNSVFVDENFNVYPDQWAVLSAIHRIPIEDVFAYLDVHAGRGDTTGVSRANFDLDAENTVFKSKSCEVPCLTSTVDVLDIEFDNQIYFSKDQLTPGLQTALMRMVSFHNPDFYQAQSCRLSTRNKPRIICCAENQKKRLGLGRGVWDQVTELLKAQSIAYRVNDSREQVPSRKWIFQGNLRPKQEEAVRRLLKHDCGILYATTAFGKTVTAINMIAARGVKTLILVDRQPLLKQWDIRLKEFLGLSDGDVGVIGGGQYKPNGQLDVATFQSLIHRGKIDPIIQQYGFVIVDECHHVAAFTYETLLKHCRCRFILGLSATIHRKDGHHPIIHMQCGPIRYRVSAKDAREEQPFIHQVYVKRVSTALQSNSEEQEALKIHQIYQSLIHNESRNQHIVNDVLASLKDGRRVVIITERTEHLKVLQNLLSDVPNVFVMQGGMGRKKLASVQEAYFSVPENENKVLIATGRFLGEGFDDQQLDTLFLTMPISWKGTLAQYAGRLHRIFDRKMSVQIYDYVDVSNATTLKMFERRLKGYKQIGYQILDSDNAQQLL